MLSWLGIVIVVTLATSAIRGDMLFAVVVVAPPTLLIIGFAAALIEIIGAIQGYNGNVVATAIAVAGTTGLYAIGIPISLALMAAIAQAERWFELALSLVS